MAIKKNNKPRTEAEIQALFAKANSKGKPDPVELPGEIAMAAQPIEITQLPPWAEALRCLPNEIVRSALFNARNRNLTREYLKDIEIAVIGDGRITYRGEELRQDDATVWMQMIHWAKDLPLGTTIEFTAYAFCKAVKWPICNGSYERLRTSLRRMQATSLAVYSTRLKEGVSMSMIPIFEWKNTGKILKRYQVQLAPQLVALFGDMRYTRVEWEQRLALPDGLATWLHAYFASHREPYPIKVTTVHTGAGMTDKSITSLRQSITNALEQLKAVGFLLSWSIKDDLVSVKRAPQTKI